MHMLRAFFLPTNIQGFFFMETVLSFYCPHNLGEIFSESCTYKIFLTATKLFMLNEH